MEGPGGGAGAVAGGPRGLGGVTGGPTGGPGGSEGGAAVGVGTATGMSLSLGALRAGLCAQSFVLPNMSSKMEKNPLQIVAGIFFTFFTFSQV